MANWLKCKSSSRSRQLEKPRWWILIQKLYEVQSVYAYEFDGRRFDVGEKFGFIETTIEFALKRPELRNQLLELFEKKLQESLVNEK